MKNDYVPFDRAPAQRLTRFIRWCVPIGSRFQAFTAFHELALAARTDRDLAHILVPVQDEFRERWYQQAIDLFPEWQGDRARFDLALALAQNVLEGMAINRLTHGLDERMVEPILNDLERQIETLKPDVIKG
jgi:hypothetical protein